MRESPLRLRRLTAVRPMFARRDVGTAVGWDSSFGGADGFGLLRRARAVRRGVTVMLWTLLCMPIQAVCLLLPGRAKVAFARCYWSMVSRLLGVQVRVIGSAAGVPGGRPIVFVSNHSSWLDVPVLGGCLDACFVSKNDVAGWPLISTVARLGRTVFVSRQRGATGRERDMMRGRLARGDNLLLFPEGTTSDGSRVLPFRSSFFSIAEGQDPPFVQPVSIVYDRLGGLPTGRAARPIFAWYGDMDIGLALLAAGAAPRPARQHPAAHPARSGPLRQPQGAGARGLEVGRRRRGNAPAEPAGRGTGGAGRRGARTRLCLNHSG